MNYKEKVKRYIKLIKILFGFHNVESVRKEKLENEEWYDTFNRLKIECKELEKELEGK